MSIHARKCRSCDADIAKPALRCPSCGAAFVGFSRGQLIAIGIFTTALILFVVKIGSSNADKTATNAVFVESTPPTQERILSKDETAQALSDYMMKVHASLFVHSVTQQTLLAKIKQDIQFLALDKYQADAEALKKLAFNFQDEVFAIAYPNEESLGEQYKTIFEKVVGEVNSLAASNLIVAADISASAHTGIDFSKDLEKDIQDVEKTRRALDKTVMAAYKQLGIPPSMVNKENFTLLGRR